MSQKYLDIAKKELGVHEVAGEEANQRIIEYDACTTLKATSDETAWCSAFACWVVENSGDRSTRSAAARSWLDWGQPIPNPEPGCIVVLERKTINNPNSAHVCFFAGDAADPEHFLGLGGNQADCVCIISQPYSKVIGFRKP